MIFDVPPLKNFLDNAIETKTMLLKPAKTSAYPLLPPIREYVFQIINRFFVIFHSFDFN
jgi:hypothetical protein